MKPTSARHGKPLLGIALFLMLGAGRPEAGLSVKIEGEDYFNARQLMKSLPDPPEKLEERQLRFWGEDAVYELESFYRQWGFFGIQVKSVIRNAGAPGSWLALFRVSEGPRYDFGRVRVEGDSGAVYASLKLEAREGRPYEEEALFRDQRQIVRALGNAGFVRARISEESLRRDSTRTVDIVYGVSSGPAFVFDTLLLNLRRAPPADSLEGLTRERLLRDLIPYHRGDTVRIDRNDKAIEKLQSTGLFNSVRLEDSVAREGGTSTGLLILDLEEGVPGHLNTSLFFETQYGFGFSGSAVHSNVAGSMKEVRLGTVFAQNKQSASAGFGSPLLWGRLLRFDDDFLVEWFQDKVPAAPVLAGDFHAVNSASLSRVLTRWLRVVGGAELDFRSQLVSDSGTLLLSRERQGSLNFLNTVFLSFVDQPLNPARGTRYALTWGNGSPLYEAGRVAVLRRHNWLEAKSAYYYYRPPWSQVKAAFRLDGGRFFGSGKENSDRFFLGGPRSVRSYGFHQLCPDRPAPPVGSCPLLQEDLEPAYFLASAELRLSPFDFSLATGRVSKYLAPLQIVPFVDYGKVWNLLGNESFSLGRKFLLSGYGEGEAFGGGLRYPILGIFNLRLDLAWGRPGGGNWPDEWVVDLAQAF